MQSMLKPQATATLARTMVRTIPTYSFFHSFCNEVSRVPSHTLKTKEDGPSTANTNSPGTRTSQRSTSNSNPGTPSTPQPTIASPRRSARKSTQRKSPRNRGDLDDDDVA